jgi:hypothetical protein
LTVRFSPGWVDSRVVLAEVRAPVSEAAANTLSPPLRLGASAAGVRVEGEPDSLDEEQASSANGNSAKTAKRRSCAPPRTGRLPGAWDDKPQARIRKGRTVRTRGVHRVSAAPSSGTRNQGEMPPPQHQGMNQR